MRQVAVIAAIILACMQARSQSFVGLKLGASFPVKELESEDFARTGFNIHLHGARFFNENVGLGGTLGKTFIPIDIYGSQLATPGAVAFAQDEYGYFFCGIGPAFFFPLNDDFAVRGKVYFGLLAATHGSTVIGYEDGSISRLDKMSDQSIGTSIGLSVERNASDDISLSVGLDLLTGSPTYEYGGKVGDIEQNVLLVNFDISINYLF